MLPLQMPCPCLFLLLLQAAPLPACACPGSGPRAASSGGFLAQTPSLPSPSPYKQRGCPQLRLGALLLGLAPGAAGGGAWSTSRQRFQPGRVSA
jgi:hypothetical protein